VPTEDVANNTEAPNLRKAEHSRVGYGYFVDVHPTPNQD